MMSDPHAFSVRHAQPEEMSQVGNLVARIFSKEMPHRYNTYRHRSGEPRLQKPGFDPAMSRIGLEAGQIVSHARVEPYRLRYGEAVLHAAGIGAVCTHPDYRGHGYASAVMRDALAFMAEQGAHLALLTTHSGDFYRRFGFSMVWPYYFLEVDSAQAARLPAPLRLREVELQDIPQMAALYDKHWGGRITFERTPENWLWRVGEGSYVVQVVDDAAGQISGYICGHDLSGDPVEVVADSLDATITLLAEAGRIYQQAGESSIRWYIPPDDVIVNYARQVLTVTVSACYDVSGGWMARLIDTSGLADALIYEIVAQGQTVIPDLNTRTLIFKCQSDAVDIGLRDFPHTHCRLKHNDFIQLLFGSLRPAALAIRPHSRLHPDAVRLLEALFPPRIAALAPWDWF